MRNRSSWRVGYPRLEFKSRSKNRKWHLGKNQSANMIKVQFEFATPVQAGSACGRHRTKKWYYETSIFERGWPWIFRRGCIDRYQLCLFFNVNGGRGSVTDSIERSWPWFLNCYGWLLIFSNGCRTLEGMTDLHRERQKENRKIGKMAGRSLSEVIHSNW